MNLTDAQLAAIRRRLEQRYNNRLWSRAYNLTVPESDQDLRRVLDELDRLRTMQAPRVDSDVEIV